MSGKKKKETGKRKIKSFLKWWVKYKGWRHKTESTLRDIVGENERAKRQKKWDKDFKNIKEKVIDIEDRQRANLCVIGVLK